VLIRRVLVGAAALVALLAAAPTDAQAAFTPNGTEYHPLRNAHFYGSTGSMTLVAPVTSMIATPTGRGYLLLARDGGLFSFGDSHFLGSLPGKGWCPGPAALAFAQTPKAGGYWMLLSDGQVLPFGNANPWGQPATTHAKAVAIAAAQ
jgi:hypothetical protein